MCPTINSAVSPEPRVASYYPAVIPTLCLGSDETLLKPENYRALAHNFYGAGADGVSVFNYQYHWARRTGTARYPGPPESYPLALRYLRQLRDPSVIACGVRHYRFHPLWSGREAPTGATKNDKVVLAREAGSRGQYRFRLCERFSLGTRAVLTFNAQGLRPHDEIAVHLNGASIQDFQRSFHADGRLEKFGRLLPPFSSVWFDLKQPPLTSWDNHLDLRLTSSKEGATDPIVVDEVEVVVMPP